MVRARRAFAAVALDAALAAGAAQAVAQARSVHPGINSPYEYPDFARSVRTFESEGREVYDRRSEIVAALGLKPGMRVADVGAGTGLFVRLLSPAVGPQGRVHAVDIAPEFKRNIARLDPPRPLAGRQSGGRRLPAHSRGFRFLDPRSRTGRQKHGDRRDRGCRLQAGRGQTAAQGQLFPALSPARRMICRLRTTAAIAAGMRPL